MTFLPKCNEFFNASNSQQGATWVHFLLKSMIPARAHHRRAKRSKNTMVLQIVSSRGGERAGDQPHVCTSAKTHCIVFSGNVASPHWWASRRSTPGVAPVHCLEESSTQLGVRTVEGLFPGTSRGSLLCSPTPPGAIQESIGIARN